LFHQTSDAINGEKEVANASRVEAVDVVGNCSLRPAEEILLDAMERLSIHHNAMTNWEH
jgi:hypothetical protein